MLPSATASRSVTQERTVLGPEHLPDRGPARRPWRQEAHVRRPRMRPLREEKPS